MPYVNKENLTIKELSGLYPTYGILDKVNFGEVKYFKDDITEQLWEISICTDGSLNKKIEQLEKFQKTKNLLNSFGL